MSVSPGCSFKKVDGLCVCACVNFFESGQMPDSTLAGINVAYLLDRMQLCMYMSVYKCV